MRRDLNIDHDVIGGPALELVLAIERYVYRNPSDKNEEVIFQQLDDELLIYALDAIQISENTALHRVLSDLAYIIFYLDSYDDLDWIGLENIPTSLIMQ